MFFSKHRLRSKQRKRNVSQSKKYENESIKLFHESKYLNTMNKKEALELQMSLEKQNEIQNQKKAEAMLENYKNLNNIKLGDFLYCKYYLNKKDLEDNNLLEIYKKMNCDFTEDFPWYFNPWLSIPGFKEKEKFLMEHGIKNLEYIDVVMFSKKKYLEAREKAVRKNEELNKKNEKYTNEFSNEKRLFGQGEYKVGFTIPNETIDFYGEGQIEVYNNKLEIEKIIKILTHKINGDVLLPFVEDVVRIEEHNFKDSTIIKLDGCFGIPKSYRK